MCKNSVGFIVRLAHRLNVEMKSEAQKEIGNKMEFYKISDSEWRGFRCNVNGGQ